MGTRRGVASCCRTRILTTLRSSPAQRGLFWPTTCRALGGARLTIRLHLFAPIRPSAAAGGQRPACATPRGRRHGAAGRGARLAPPPPAAACFGARRAAFGGGRAARPRTPFSAEAAALAHRHAWRPQRRRRRRREWRRSPVAFRAVGTHRPRPPGRRRGSGQPWRRRRRQGPRRQRYTAAGRSYRHARRWQRQRGGQQGASRRLDLPRLRGASVLRQDVGVFPLQGASPRGQPRRRSRRAGARCLQRDLPWARWRRRGPTPPGKMGHGGMRRGDQPASSGGQLPILPCSWGEHRSQG